MNGYLLIIDWSPYVQRNIYIKLLYWYRGPEPGPERSSSRPTLEKNTCGPISINLIYAG
jgi:hypothetical protein